MLLGASTVLEKVTVVLERDDIASKDVVVLLQEMQNLFELSNSPVESLRLRVDDVEVDIMAAMAAVL